MYEPLQFLRFDVRKYIFIDRELDNRGVRALVNGPISLHGSSAQMTGASKSIFEYLQQQQGTKVFKS